TFTTALGQKHTAEQDAARAAPAMRRHEAAALTAAQADAQQQGAGSAADGTRPAHARDPGPVSSSRRTTLPMSYTAAPVPHHGRCPWVPSERGPAPSAHQCASDVRAPA